METQFSNSVKNCSISDIEQIDLEQLFLVSVLTQGILGFDLIPKNFRTTVFSVSSHQKIFRTIELVIQEKLTLDFVTVSQKLENKLAREFAVIVSSISPSRCFSKDQINEGAFELIRRGESRKINSTEFIPYADQSICEENVKLEWIRGNDVYGMELPQSIDLVENIFREKSLNFLAGEENSGKSILATNLAISVAVGFNHFLSWKIKKHGPVFLLNTEMYFEDLASRFKNMCGIKPPDGLSSIYVPRQVPSFDMCWEELNRMCAEVRPVLFVIDCLYFFHNLDENDSSTMKLLIRRLQSLRDRYGLCVLVVHHTKKGTRSENLHNDLMRGAGVFGAAADTVLMMKRSQKEESKRIIKPTKLRHSSDIHRSARLLSLEQQLLWFQDEGQADEMEHLESQSSAQAVDTIDFSKVYGPVSELKRSEILLACDKWGYSIKTIDRCIKSAVMIGTLTKMKHGIFRYEGPRPPKADGHLDTPLEKG